MADKALKQLYEEKSEALGAMRVHEDARPYRLARLERHAAQVEAMINSRLPKAERARKEGLRRKAVRASTATAALSNRPQLLSPAASIASATAQPQPTLPKLLPRPPPFYCCDPRLLLVQASAAVRETAEAKEAASVLGGRESEAAFDAAQAGTIEAYDDDDEPPADPFEEDGALSGAQNAQMSAAEAVAEATAEVTAESEAAEARAVAAAREEREQAEAEAAVQAAAKVAAESERKRLKVENAVAEAAEEQAILKAQVEQADRDRAAVAIAEAEREREERERAEAEAEAEAKSEAGAEAYAQSEIEDRAAAEAAAELAAAAAELAAEAAGRAAAEVRTKRKQAAEAATEAKREQEERKAAEMAASDACGGVADVPQPPPGSRAGEQLVVSLAAPAPAAASSSSSKNKKHSHKKRGGGGSGDSGGGGGGSGAKAAARAAVMAKYQTASVQKLPSPAAVVSPVAVPTQEASGDGKKDGSAGKDDGKEGREDGGEEGGTDEAEGATTDKGMCAYDLSGWGGKTPKTMLIEWFQKRQQPRPKIDVDVAGRRYRATVTVHGGLVYSLPEDESFVKRDDAEQAAATMALLLLFPDQPLYRLLPPSYRSLWIKWQAKAKVCSSVCTSWPPPLPRFLKSATAVTRCRGTLPSAASMHCRVIAPLPSLSCFRPPVLCIRPTGARATGGGRCARGARQVRHSVV